jgi:hypothetical protein
METLDYRRGYNAAAILAVTGFGVTRPPCLSYSMRWSHSMPKTRKARKSLSAKDFAGAGEPYSEIVVTISIRFLGLGITRSRLAVNTVPDPALEPLARELLKAMKIESYGLNEHGDFGACLSEHLNGWQDMAGDYPKIAEKGPRRSYRGDAQAMNSSIKKSVDWIAQLHKQGMASALLNDTHLNTSQRPQ